VFIIPPLMFAIMPFYEVLLVHDPSIFFKLFEKMKDECGATQRLPFLCDELIPMQFGI